MEMGEKNCRRKLGTRSLLAINFKMPMCFTIGHVASDTYIFNARKLRVFEIQFLNNSLIDVI